MGLAEPTTTLTDYVLAVLGAGLGLRLLRYAAAHGASAPRHWALALMATALAALSGGTSHGFAPHLARETLAVLWRVTYGLVGLADLLLLWGAIRALSHPALHGGLLAAALVKFVAYALLALSRREFRWVILDLALTLAGLLALALRARLGRHPELGSWLLAAVGVSLAGALVQQSGWALHRHFNHNDLFHVVQMGGLYFFYRAGRLLPEPARR